MTRRLPSYSGERGDMAAIIGIAVVVFLALLFLLFRSMGRMQPPSAQERMKHSPQEVHHTGPRASGLN